MTTYLYLLTVGGNDHGVQVHRLKIQAFVPVGDGGVQAAHLGGKGIHSWSAPCYARSEFLPVLHHEKGFIGKAPDNTVGAVDDEFPAGMLEMPEKIAVGMMTQILILQRRR